MFYFDLVWQQVDKLVHVREYAAAEIFASPYQHADQVPALELWSGTLVCLILDTRLFIWRGGCVHAAGVRT